MFIALLNCMSKFMPCSCQPYPRLVSVRVHRKSRKPVSSCPMFLALSCLHGQCFFWHVFSLSTWSVSLLTCTILLRGQCLFWHVLTLFRVSVSSDMTCLVLFTWSVPLLTCLVVYMVSVYSGMYCLRQHGQCLFWHVLSLSAWSVLLLICLALSSWSVYLLTWIDSFTWSVSLLTCPVVYMVSVSSDMSCPRLHGQCIFWHVFYLCFAWLWW